MALAVYLVPQLDKFTDEAMIGKFCSKLSSTILSLSGLALMRKFTLPCRVAISSKNGVNTIK
jgi:hypothetical protein